MITELYRKNVPATRTLDDIINTLESGTWQTAMPEQIPLISTYMLIHWVFDYPRQSCGYRFPFDRPAARFLSPAAKGSPVTGASSLPFHLMIPPIS